MLQVKFVNRSKVSKRSACFCGIVVRGGGRDLLGNYRGALMSAAQLPSAKPAGLHSANSQVFVHPLLVV